MNKSLISILLVVFLAVISGCAETGSGGGTSSGGGTGSVDGTGNSNTPSYDISSIPEDKTPIELTKYTSIGGTEYTRPKPVTITNPREEAGQYYPILISTAMGLNGEGGSEMTNVFGTIVKGVGYKTFFESDTPKSKLVFGEGRDMYDLTNETALKEKGQGEYYVGVDQWKGAMPSEGKLVIAFLTKEEAEEYIPSNKDIVLQPESDTKYNPKFLDSKIVDELNKLGALRQYTFTVK